MSVTFIIFHEIGNCFFVVGKAGDDYGKQLLKNKISEIQHGGGTDILEAIKDALDLLSSKGIIGGEIMLMTDGDDGTDYVSQVLPEAERLQVKIHTCAITTDASTLLPDLSEKTGGEYFMISNGGDIGEFINVMTGLLAQITSTDDTVSQLNILTETMSVSKDKETSMQFYLDRGLSQHTILSVFYNNKQVESISGRMISPSKTQIVNCTDDQRFSKLDCQFKQKPMEGQWTLAVTPKMVSGYEQSSVTVSVSASVENDLDGTFLVKGYIGVDELNFGSDDQSHQPWLEMAQVLDSQVLMASVRYNRWAVLNARVVARITHSYSSDSSIDLEMKDDGSAYHQGQGADLYENDGVYSVLLDSNLFESGHYSVQISVTGDDYTFYVSVFFYIQF